MPTSIAYSEAQLVDLLKARDQQGFNYLYKRYHTGLYTQITRLIPDNENVQEVLQDVFQTIWQKIDYYDATKGCLYTWMLQITHNTTIDKLRSKAYRSKAMDKSIDMVSQHGVYLPDQNSPTEQQIINNIALKKAIEQLNYKYRSLIYLSYINGYTHVQIAQIQQIPIGTVKTRLHHALAQLKEQLCQN